MVKKILSSMNYSPFGAPLKGRTFNGSGSRYGFNGQEKDNEIAGAGNSMTAEYWQYDSRLGRRWNIDPIIKPWESSYATFADNPIMYSDPNGDDIELTGEAKKTHDSKYNKTEMRKGFLGLGKLKERSNKSYNAEYAKLYDKLSDDHTILVKAGDPGPDNSGGSLTPDAMYDSKNRLVLNANYNKPNEFDGGTEIHGLMEELFHAGQNSDQGKIDGNGRKAFVSGSIMNEVAAKEFAIRTGGAFASIYEHNGIIIPTSTSIMSGQESHELKHAYQVLSGYMTPMHIQTDRTLFKQQNQLQNEIEGYIRQILTDSKSQLPYNLDSIEELNKSNLNKNGYKIP